MSATRSPHVSPYGSWPSPIAALDLVVGAAGLSEIIVDDRDIWFSESRPDQGGRVALMRLRPTGSGDTELVEMSGPEANVRTRVHEYGGGAWYVSDETLWYVDDSDQRLRRQDADGTITFLTPEPDEPRAVRFADGRPTADKAWFVCVRETHEPNGHEPINDLVAVAGDGSGAIEVLASGADFYSSPRLSANGEKLAWIQWDHPNMPWDATELWLGECAGGTLVSSRQIAGHHEPTSIVFPGFTSTGELWAVSDHHEWWNLYRFASADRTPVGPGPEPVLEGSFEVATPGWVFGLARWAEVDGYAIAALTDPGGDTITATATGEVLADWSAVSAVRRHGDGVVFIGARHHGEAEIVRWTPGSAPQVVRPARDLGIDEAFFPAPEHIVFPTSEGEEAHGWFYAPAHDTAVGPVDERPPLLVAAHGGPTGRARTELQLSIRYWTSRGFAVVDVDYRGSTGYGRTYRHALRDRWGIADVEDCVAAALFLSDEGRVDRDRIVIKGGSAGGLTVLGALADSDVFAAGASRYGVADLSALARDTHKFEARYCDRLVAPWPEGEAIYAARSPINRTEMIETPMIVLQGDADPVVPKNQSDAVVAALVANGVRHAYLVFPGVAHGFRDADTIVTALEAELSFFCQILGIEPAGEIPTLELV